MMKNALYLLLLFSCNTFSQKTYYIGVQNFYEYHPYSEFKNGIYKGFNRDVLDLFARSQGFEFKYEPRPIKRLYAEFLAGDFDFKYPDNTNWALDIKAAEKIYYSQAVVSYSDGLMVKRENIGKSFNELQSISLINGYSPENSYIERNKKGKLEIIRTNSYQRLLQLVAENRVDGAYFNVAVSQHYNSYNMQGDDLVFDKSHPHINSVRSLSSIKHPKLILLFDQFLIDKKPQIDALKIQYNIIEGRVKPHNHGYKH